MAKVKNTCPNCGVEFINIPFPWGSGVCTIGCQWDESPSCVEHGLSATMCIYCGDDVPEWKKTKEPEQLELDLGIE